MKLTIQTADLRYALSVAGRALTGKPVRPIMEGILLRAKDGTATLTGTNGSITLRSAIPAMIDEEGETVLPGRLLSELARKLPGRDTTITLDGPRAAIRSGASRTGLSVMAANEFPEPPEIVTKHTLTVKQGALKTAIAGTAYCVSTDDSRLLLTGVYLDAAQDVRMVALDGFRMACAEVDATHDGDFAAVIPGKSMAELGRLMNYDNQSCEVRFDGHMMVASNGSDTLYTTLLAGEYVDYKKIIPNGFATSTLVNRSDLLAAIDRASVISRDNSLVRLTVRDTSVTVASRDEIGQIEDTVDAVTTGPEIVIALNAHYMTDALKAMTDEDVTLNFNSPTTPCVILPKEGHSALNLVLPVRVAE